MRNLPQRWCINCKSEITKPYSTKVCQLSCWYQFITKPLLKKNCLTCNVEFSHKRNQRNRRWCSQRCAKKYKSPVVDKNCEQCSKVFTPWYAGQRFCSQKCARKWKKLHSNRPKANCGVCKASFFPNRKPKKLGVLFCSMGCYGKYLKIRYEKTHKTSCLFCKKRYVIPPHTRVKETRKFCSRSCMFKYWAKNAKTGAMSIEEGIFNVGLRATGAWARKHFNPLASLTSVDFYVPKLKLCVYVDGVYWHGRAEVVRRDKRQDKILKAAGFKVLRISDIKVRKLGPEGVKKLLDKIIGESKCQKAI